MNIVKLIALLLFIIKNVYQVESFIDPATLAVLGTIVGGISYLINSPKAKEATIKYGSKALERACQVIGYCEGCEDYWIPGNLKDLEYELRSEVFGQPLAVDVILGALKTHLKNKDPERSLVLSFQGPPGTGKNFISKMILKHMFKEGVHTKYAVFKRATIDFPLESEVGKYKEKLIDEIKEKVLDCHRSVFVFDEVEKMPNGILDVVSGFVAAKRHRDYDFRRVIFILLSNVGTEEITSKAIDAWKEGTKRENISLKDLSDILAKASYNSKGGLNHTRLVRNGDISYYVPFLPLMTQHVVQCLNRHVSVVKKQIMSPELTELVIDELTWYPELERLFTVHGCKGIAEKADFLIEREITRRRKSM